MNTLRVKCAVTFAVSASLLALTGCSSMQPSHEYVVDSQKVFQVNQAARTSAHQVDVIWVNPPRKRIEKK